MKTNNHHTFEISSLSLVKRGKVRDIYKLDEGLLFIASDRISAFDKILPNPIPDKGRILTALSVHWFHLTEGIISNHLITDKLSQMPLPLDIDSKELSGRSLYVKRAQPISFECIVRGYLAGSAWREYVKTGRISGVELAKGLKKGDKFSEPIFTPSTKAEEGHDINVSFDMMSNELGVEIANKIKEVSIELFNFASDYSAERNLLLVDTKFEFGILDGKIILIDEIFTPDSSRYWKKVTYQPGKLQEGLDKEFVREYLREQEWIGDGNPPILPEEIIKKTHGRYFEVFQMLTGKSNFSLDE